MSTSASTQVRARLKAVVATTFAAEAITAEDDRLNPSLGQGSPRCAIYPEREAEMPGDANSQETDVVVQFYNTFDAQINPEQAVNPSIIEGYAARLADALRTQRGIGNEYCWYFRVLSTDYPDDPTGNKTRFLMHVRAFGANPSAL